MNSKSQIINAKSSAKPDIKPNATFLVPYLANVNHQFDHLQPTVSEAIVLTEKYAVSKLKIDWKIDVVVTGINSSVTVDGGIPPNESVGGCTYWSDFLFLNIDENSEKINLSAIFTILCHELFHACRYHYCRETEKGPASTADENWNEVIFSHCLEEGLALYFECQSAHDNNFPITKATSDMTKAESQEVKEIYKLVKPYFDQPVTNHSLFYQDGGPLDDGNLPYWALYKLGYFWVGKYLEYNYKNSSKVEPLNLAMINPDNLKKFDIEKYFTK